MDERVATNQRRWDEMADLHLVTYHVDEVDSARRYSLKPFETAELGPIDGSRICHLQCHLGDNSFALAQLGAAEVVGVDFSTRSVAIATTRAHRVGLDDRVRFVQATVDDSVEAVGPGYDGVYTSWGVLCWLPDILRWATTVHQLLLMGGWLYLADTHPYAAAARWRGYPYGGTTAFFDDDQGDYTDAHATFRHPEAWHWNHGLGEVVTALASVGLRLEWLHEHAVVAWHLGDEQGLSPRPDGMWEVPGSSLPLSFSLRAVKAAGTHSSMRAAVS
jgi:2-polyprenyl-3-methyl-5-hydroxy-6-metoxy-1,4-benzoquinol methylase